MNTTIYHYNNLPFYSEQDLLLKDYLVKTITLELKQILKGQNRAWDFVQIEAPCLIPRQLINQNYTNDDLWVQESTTTEMVLKPETTPSTYAYILKDIEHQQFYPPICYFQVSKSFRREQDQPSKHCRFKEFYQLEYQCVYTADTKNDYQSNTIKQIASMLQRVVGLPTRVVLSDRLPDYSIKTLDVEVWNGDKWMEICSCSLRKDFPAKPKVRGKEQECLVLEIAIGIDRLIYNIGQRGVVFEQLSEVVDHTTQE